MAIDISIEGRGFYSITGESARGRKWINSSVEGSAGGAACSDDMRFTEEIASGATASGLVVSVNGYVYLSGGLRGEPIA